jgi:hypothetical protein
MGFSSFMPTWAGAGHDQPVRPDRETRSRQRLIHEPSGHRAEDSCGAKRGYPSCCFRRNPAANYVVRGRDRVKPVNRAARRCKASGLPRAPPWTTRNNKPCPVIQRQLLSQSFAEVMENPKVGTSSAQSQKFTLHFSVGGYRRQSLSK